MGRFLNLEAHLFARARNSELYVDKSGLIEYTNRCINTEQCYINVSRPRRFGKSMAANMLVAYYSRGCQSRSLFDDLSIAKSPSYLEHLNRYNVIFFNTHQFPSFTPHF